MLLLFTQCVQTTEGEAREEIWSPVNYLFFMSTALIYGKNQQIRETVERRPFIPKANYSLDFAVVCISQGMTVKKSGCWEFWNN